MIKKYLVIGNPIEHSLSPKLHNYWLKKNNIDAVYDKKNLDENELRTRYLAKLEHQYPDVKFEI